MPNRAYKVYVHINKANGKMYFGLTRQEPRRRWQKGGYKSCPLFERAIEKYGWDGFEHIVLFDKLTASDAGKLEYTLIDLFQTTNPLHGYNCVPGGLFRPYLSEETKEKIRLANVGKRQTSETISKRLQSRIDSGIPWFTQKARENCIAARSIKISQYDLSGQWISDWNSISDASRHLGIAHQNISRCLTGDRYSCGGYRWSYFSKAIVEPKRSTRSILQIDMNTGSVVATFESMEEAQRCTGIPKSNICKVCSGERRSAGGYVWKEEK